MQPAAPYVSPTSRLPQSQPPRTLKGDSPGDTLSMNRTLLAVALLALPAATLAQAPAAPVGPAAEVQGSYSRLKPNVIKAAEKMPADDYTYKPTPEIRSYARVVNHITEAQFHTCTALNGTAFDKASVPADHRHQRGHRRRSQGFLRPMRQGLRLAHRSQPRRECHCWCGQTIPHRHGLGKRLAR